MMRDPIEIVGPFFIIAIVAEFFLWRHRLAKDSQRQGGEPDYYDPPDTAASLTMGFVNGIERLAAAAPLYGIFSWIFQYRMFDISMNFWGWVGLFLADDLCFYWYHRFAHVHRFWWASHVVHHSSQHYNLSTALRQPWVGTLFLTWLPWAPLALIGFPPEAILVQMAFSLIYQFWVHTRMIDRLPRWIEFIFNTPSHHRVHHARNPAYLDSNYGGILIIWDRIFGSFTEEDKNIPIDYGLVQNIGTFNVFRIAFHEPLSLLADLVRAPDWSSRIGYLFRPPGWRPDGTGKTSAVLKRQWHARYGAGDRSDKMPYKL